jgi:ornithine decarboxylase
MRRQGVDLRLLDLGGGFPAHLEGGCPPLAAYGAAIERHLSQHFGEGRPKTRVEPGRAVVGDAGTLVSTVIAVLRRGRARWVYLDAGVFTGLVETLDEAIRYPLRTNVDGGPTGPCVLAGPTCDSADVLYERDPVQLPLSLAEGDTVELLAAGAYTTCYSTVGFNGFAPLPTVLQR